MSGLFGKPSDASLPPGVTYEDIDEHFSEGEEMSNEETALVEKLPNPIEISDGGVVLRNLNDVWGYARGIINAKMHPNSLDTVDKVAIAILTGAEVGWKPMLSVRSLAVINGVPAWVTTAARALVQDSGKLKAGTAIQEGVIHADDCQYEQQGKRCADGCYGYCRTHHKDHATQREAKFYVHQAKTANLWTKKGPWQEYPTRMLMHRAAGFHFRDCWGNVLNGLDVAEAVADYPPAAFVKDGDTVATYTDPPGLDPLLARANEPATDSGGEVQKEGAGVPPSDGPKTADDPAPSDEVQEEGGGNGPKGGMNSAVTGGAGSPLAESGPDTPPAPPPSDDHGLVVDEPPEAAATSEMICARVGCGIVINRLDVRWKAANGWRCADCGPEEKV